MVNRVESFLKIKQNCYSNVPIVERFCNPVNKCDNSLLCRMRRSKPKLVFIECLIFSIFFFFRKNYLLLSCATSVEIISFRGNSLSNRPIDLKIGLNVREGVVHVQKAWFFEIRIASCKFFAIHANCERYCRISLTIIVRVSIYASTCGQTYCSL